MLFLANFEFMSTVTALIRSALFSWNRARNTEQKQVPSISAAYTSCLTACDRTTAAHGQRPAACGRSFAACGRTPAFRGRIPAACGRTTGDRDHLHRVAQCCNSTTLHQELYHRTTSVLCGTPSSVIHTRAGQHNAAFNIFLGYTSIIGRHFNCCPSSAWTLEYIWACSTACTKICCNARILYTWSFR